jgi:hypothetical protein
MQRERKRKKGKEGEIMCVFGRERCRERDRER